MATRNFGGVCVMDMMGLILLTICFLLYLYAILSMSGRNIFRFKSIFLAKNNKDDDEMIVLSGIMSQKELKEHNSIKDKINRFFILTEKEKEANDRWWRDFPFSGW